MDTNEIFKKSEQSSGTINLFKNFADRQKNLFEQLNNAEKSVNKSQESDVSIKDIERITLKRKRSETKHFQGRESIFKRPEAPLSQCLPRRTLPAFTRQPHKWTKYTLNDVPDADISEQGNTTAALSFLRELEDRKAKDDDVDMDTDVTSKIIFNSKSKAIQDVTAVIQDAVQERENKPIFKGSKIVMPEYIIGQKKKSSKKIGVNKKPVEKNKELKLDHLLEDEDGD